MAWKTKPAKRSYACNPEAFTFARDRAGLTQAQLAKLAGYSERLITKAESGRPISAATVADLADALSSDDHPVHPEDLVSDPLQMAKDYIVAVYRSGKDCVDDFAHFLDADVVFRIAGDPEQIPFAGEHRGVDAMRRAFEIFFSILEAPKDHAPLKDFSFVVNGNEVTMTGESWIHPIGAPLEKPIMLMHRYVFQRGKLVLLEDIYDTMAGKQALDAANQAARQERP